jgi:hypothetical protein
MAVCRYCQQEVSGNEIAHFENCTQPRAREEKNRRRRELYAQKNSSKDGKSGINDPSWRQRKLFGPNQEEIVRR